MILIDGTVFGVNGEEYVVKEMIGSGGFGDVFKIARKTDLALYALKVAKVDGFNTEEYDALVNEAHLAPQIRHPNVVSVDFFHDGKLHPSLPPYLIMEFAEQGSLKSILETRRSSKNHFTNAELKDLFLQICNGMKAINEKLIHRDFHPGNVLVHRGDLKITDFGLSKVADVQTRAQTFKGVQHIYYKAPESWAMQKNTIQMDMYSVGISMFELAALSYPYKIEKNAEQFIGVQNAHFYGLPGKLEAIRPDVDGGLVELINRLMKKKPSDRFSNWDDAISLIGTSGSIGTIDVSSLVEKARATDNAIESEKIRRAAVTAEAKSKLQNLEFLAGQIREDFESVCATFNRQTKTAELKITKHADNIGFSILGARHAVSFDFEISSLVERIEPDVFGRAPRKVYELLKLDQKEVMAWAHVSVDSGLGANLILLKNEDADLYGSWKVLIHKQSAFSSQQTRTEPFAITTWKEFTNRVQLLRTMDVIVTRVTDYTTNELMFLVNEVV